VNGVKVTPVCGEEVQRVGPVELERVVGLITHVDANDVETRL